MIVSYILYHGPVWFATQRTLILGSSKPDQSNLISHWLQRIYNSVTLIWSLRQVALQMVFFIPPCREQPQPSELDPATGLPDPPLGAPARRDGRAGGIRRGARNAADPSCPRQHHHPHGHQRVATCWDAGRWAAVAKLRQGQDLQGGLQEVSRETAFTISCFSSYFVRRL